MKKKDKLDKPEERIVHSYGVRAIRDLTFSKFLNELDNDGLRAITLSKRPNSIIIPLTASGLEKVFKQFKILLERPSHILNVLDDSEYLIKELLLNLYVFLDDHISENDRINLPRYSVVPTDKYSVGKDKKGQFRVQVSEGERIKYLRGDINRNYDKDSSLYIKLYTDEDGYLYHKLEENEDEYIEEIRKDISGTAGEQPDPQTQQKKGRK